MFTRGGMLDVVFCLRSEDLATNRSTVRGVSNLGEDPVCVLSRQNTKIFIFMQIS